MKGYRLPVGVLAALLLCSICNARFLSGRSRELLAQLDRAEQYAYAQEWEQAADTVESGYRDWRAQRTYLHVVSRHDASNGADTLYRHCILYARAGDALNFLADLQTLREQIQTLSDMEQFSFGNIF
ncbi:MAG: DUF4363 family protein [Oscillibacter sp.]|nr:DUF4363 family protein [Oscillibacter sp.]MBQ9617951.1 DUF4363 family protein [Oscillibacter sp.]